jgi:hypothetical protein
MFQKYCAELYVLLALYVFGIAMIVNSHEVFDAIVEDIYLPENLSLNNRSKLLNKTCVNDDEVGGRVCMIPYKLKIELLLYCTNL